MSQSLLKIPIFFFLLFLFSPPAFAEKVQIPIDCTCRDQQIEMYGGKEENALYGTKENCYVSVELGKNVAEKAIDTVSDELSRDPGEPVGYAPSELGLNLETLEAGGRNALLGLRALFTDSIKGITAPFAAVFKSIAEKSPLKKLFSEMLQVVYQNHTEKYHEFLDEKVFGSAIRFVSEHDDIDTLKKAIEDMEKGTASKKGDDTCTNDNPRPKCVAKKALCSYEKYIGVLFYEAGSARTSGQKELEIRDLQQSLKSLQQRDAALVQEAQDAKTALDTAMAVYSNFFETYQLHLKFKDVIAALVKVRNRMSYLTELVACIPNKFVGVATTKCD